MIAYAWTLAFVLAEVAIPNLLAGLFNADPGVKVQAEFVIAGAFLVACLGGIAKRLDELIDTQRAGQDD